MSESNTKREREKIREIARDYERKGFLVVVEPRIEDLPSFLRAFSFRPDLIATSAKESHIVEVSSRDTAQHLRDLSPIIDAIEAAVGWEFVLVMTNPRAPEARPAQIPVLDLSDLQSPLQSLISLAELSAKSAQKYDHAVVLAAWAIIEAALRMYLETGNVRSMPRSSRSLVRDAVMYGFITAAEGQFLDSVTNLRNAIAHGALTEKVEKGTMRRLISLCESLARDVGRRTD